MTTQDKDEVARQRIITHMNEDHHDSIIRYLEHYCKLPAWKAYDGSMTDISLDTMSFVCRGRTYHIPFEPPMTSFREARERVVEMDKKCLDGLDKSDITINEFAPPVGLYAPVFLIIAATFLSYSQRWWFDKDQIVERYTGALFARFSFLIQPWLISLMICLHASEAVFFARYYLRRHSINMRSPTWWLWVATTFVEGQFAFKRFKDLVRRKADEKAKRKH